MLLLALALPPAICPPGLFPAADGRCTGSETPWALSARGPSALFLRLDGTVVSVGGAAWNETALVPASTAVIDPQDGRVEEVPDPFGGAWADAYVQLRDGRVVAVRGDDPHEDGAVGTRVLEGAVWRVASPPPASLLGATHFVEPDNSVLFVGGVTETDAAATRVWRWTPATDQWRALPDLSVGRAWPILVPGATSPVVCGGVEARKDHPAAVAGCVALGKRGWKDVPPPIPIREGAWGWQVDDGVVVVDPTGGAWRVGEGGEVTALSAAPASSEGWNAGAGGVLTSVGTSGALLRFDTHTGASSTLPSPGGGRGGVAIALDGARTLFVGEAVERASLVGVVDAAHPALGTFEGWMFALASQGPSGILVLDEVAVRRWDGERRIFVPLPDAPAPRHRPGFALLTDGRALLAGGGLDFVGTRDAWLLDGAAWRAVAPLPVALEDVHAVALSDGTAVVVGVRPDRTSASFLYAPAKDRWTELPLPVRSRGRMFPVPGGAAWVEDDESTGEMRTARYAEGRGWTQGPTLPGALTAVALLGLADGTLVAAGGRTKNDYGGTNQAWWLAPGAAEWAAGAPLTRERWGGTLVEREPGHLVLLGGEGPCELWDGERWVAAAPLDIERREPVVLPLDPSTVLVLGGYFEERGAAWELYRVLGRPTDFPPLPLPDPRLAPLSEPERSELSRRLIDADVLCRAGKVEACEEAARLVEGR